MAHIFLSYSRRDTDVMHRVRTDLQNAGLSVWTDQGIEPGTSLWKDAIEQAIEKAGCLVVILSPDAKQSIWVKRELDYASVHKVPIFSLLAQGEEAEAVPFALVGSQYVDIRKNYATNMQKLIPVVAKYVVAGTPKVSDEDLDQAIMEWIIESFRQETGIALQDSMALVRIKEAAQKARIELVTVDQADVNLPFITADQTGPKHLNLTLTRAKLDTMRNSKLFSG
jgi:hypothetical protein